MKILLSEPLCPREATWGKFRKGAGSNTFSYGLASIAAYCRKEGFNDLTFIEPQIEGMTKEDYINYLKENKFDVVGLASFTAMMDYTFDTIKLIKKALPKSVIILGGVHATLLPKETLEECEELDIVCVGEGEIVFTEILKNLNDLSNVKGVAYRKGKEIIINERQPMIENLDDIPMPAYDLFPMDKYKIQITQAKVFPTKTMIVSRGCVYDCAFCNATAVHGRMVRHKSPEKAIEEILYLKNNYNTKGIAFLDSTFTINKKWVHEFCDLMIEKKINMPWNCNSRVDTVDEEMLIKMKQAGCWSLNFGVESFLQKTLDSINKGTTVEQNINTIKLALKHGYFVHANYIICWPGEDKKDAMETIKMAKKMGTQIGLFYLPVPFPKTRLYEMCQQEGGLNEDAKWSDFNSWNYDNPVYINPKIGKKGMQKLYNYAYRTYYLTPKVIMRNLKELKSLDAVKKYFYAIRCLVGV